nr:metal-sulfur cluster assembly factor [Enemella evansiae]
MTDRKDTTMTEQSTETEQVRPSDRVRDTLPDQTPEVTDPATGEVVDGKPNEEELLEALKDVVDPELGINVVDLGLVYGLHVDDDSSVTVDMTLTSAACPLTDVIEDQTDTALKDLATRTAINWVWMPPWTPEKISDDGRDQLRMLGFNV